MGTKRGGAFAAEGAGLSQQEVRRRGWLCWRRSGSGVPCGIRVFPVFGSQAPAQQPEQDGGGEVPQPCTTLSSRCRSWKSFPCRSTAWLPGVSRGASRLPCGRQGVWPSRWADDAGCQRGQRWQDCAPGAACAISKDSPFVQCAFRG